MKLSVNGSKDSNFEIEGKKVSCKIMEAVAQRTDALTQRLAALWAHPKLAPLFVSQLVAESKKQRDSDFKAPAGVLKVRDAIKATGLINSSLFIEVEPDYYDWPLEKRAIRLGAPSPSHLCKCVVFENTRWTESTSNTAVDPYDMRNARYYCVIVQYTDKLNSQKLNDFVWADLNRKSLARKSFNLRVTGEDVAQRLTGFGKNGVSPFGLEESRIPVICTLNVMRLVPRVVYLGAGHVDWKIACPIREIMRTENWLVADLS
eukprot:jgi/Hompol1/3508/HPOL_003281-RA